jgi:hypothetical protein
MFDCLACNGTGCEVCDFSGQLDAEATAAFVNRLEADLLEEIEGFLPDAEFCRATKPFETDTDLPF